MRAESKGRLQQVVCYGPRDETGGLNFEEQRESEDLLLAYLLLSEKNSIKNKPVALGTKEEL